MIDNALNIGYYCLKGIFHFSHPNIISHMLRKTYIMLSIALPLIILLPLLPTTNTS